MSFSVKGYDNIKNRTAYHKISGAIFLFDYSATSVIVTTLLPSLSWNFVSGAL